MNIKLTLGHEFTSATACVGEFDVVARREKDNFTVEVFFGDEQH